MIKKISLVFIFILFIVSCFIFRHYLSIFYFQNDANTLALNTETYEGDILSYRLNQQNPMFYSDNLKDMKIKMPRRHVKHAALFVGSDFLYFDDGISFFKVNNSKNIVQKMAIYIEALFYNWWAFIIPYLALIIWLFKYGSDIKFKLEYPIIAILLLGLYLRLSNINYIPLWNDELYTLTVISNMGSGFNFHNIFNDPGNPPLFYLISNIWLYFFHKSILLIRLLPCAMGFVLIYGIYYATSKIINKRTALFASFLSAINIYLILESNEIRSYILAMNLVVWGGFCFYKLYRRYSILNRIIYLFLTIALINTHFYCAIYALFNYIMGIAFLKGKRFNFTIINFIALLSIIPYFLMTSLNKSFSNSFNSWIPNVSLDSLNNHIIFYFGNILFFIATIAFSIFIYQKLKVKEKIAFIYCTGAISFCFIFALLFSVIVKPILFERYFSIFLPYLILNTAIFMNCAYRAKFGHILVLIIALFSINIPKYENFNLYANIDFLARYFISDYQNNPYRSYIVIPDYKDYIKYYPQIPEDRVIVADFDPGNDLDILKKYATLIPDNPKKEPVILYIAEMNINPKVKFSNDENIKSIKTTFVPIYKITINYDKIYKKQRRGK